MILDLYNMDCRDAMSLFLPDNSVDSIVCDPPYGLTFMGKKWDYDVPGVDVWAECLRVLKPGGHLLAFAGTRTQHRMAVRIEDAGFEIRDMIAWVYGCLSEDSEVLTEEGWMPYNKAKQKNILAYDLQNDIYKWERPSRWNEYRVESDTAYRIQSDHTDQIVSRGHRCIVERGGMLAFVPADELAGVERVPYLRGDFSALPQGRGELLFQAVLRESEGLAKETFCERQGEEVSGEGFAGREKPGVEGWRDLLQAQGQVCGSVDQVRALPGKHEEHGPQGRVRDGASPCCSPGNWQATDTAGVRAPHQPQCDGQSAGELDAVCEQRGSQAVRARASYQTTVATVTAIEYSGLIWCPTVSTGAFVARRNGKVFITGNSGFPKSHNVGKSIDREAGAQREVVGKAAAGSAPLKRGHVNTSGGGLSVGTERSPEYDITAPATEAARQWQGWGTALKPALETVTFASKPYTAEQERHTIQSNLIRLEARLWLLSSASAAEENSTSNPSEYGAACAIAQWSAEEITNTRAALCGQMDTSLFELATNTSLSIVSSWRRTLAESWSDGSTPTTETGSSTTIDWRTLKFSLSRITPESIINACSLPGGFSANASTAESHFNASLSLLQSIRTLSATEPAISREQHEHLGAGVKPNLDPCIMARKPLVGTVAANVLEHGTGALNIDGCRVGDFQNTTPSGVDRRNAALAEAGYRPGTYQMGAKLPDTPPGRWPANLIHDGSGEVVAEFPQTKGQQGALTGSEPSSKTANTFGEFAGRVPSEPRGDTGSAARFFYCAKASRKDRNEGCEGMEQRGAFDGAEGQMGGNMGSRSKPRENHHPTVKPTDLMAYLCRLVTPPGGVVFDPFMGSGSTGKAALREGFGFIGCEMDAAYFAIAQARIAAMKDAA